MFEELLSNLHSYLNHFFKEISIVHAEKILHALASCKGMIFLTGAGKSGHIAQKIAATLTSTGTKATYLCPNHAVHGDLGLVSAQDLVLIFSKSGETEELLYLLAALRKRGAFTIAIVSTQGSRLAKEADLSIQLPVQREICPYDLAPTTSTIVQLIFGDCLAIALMQKRKFSILDFASNHPGGLIGRKTSFQVLDLMLKGDELPLCQKSDRLIDVIHELSVKKCGCLLVVEKGELTGIFTDGDLRRTIQTQGKEGLTSSMETLMTPSPRSIEPDTFVLEALHLMEAPPRPITVLPVVQKGKIIGLIRMHDILQGQLQSSITTENR
ncbi:MAG TPA: KpsF/GutQ family sugar-phosphate isomerase [Chlamydiales bacterium]|nr:KpsF/GutQ family sugar-phosphate isomerase [Chlamydiales bacterium]